MTRVLDGVRVVDFGHYIAGPLLAELLAQHGADVVHVDPPGGPRLAGLPDAFLNRGKRRITLDLTRAADRRAAADLVASADVVVENFRPGALAEHGLDPVEATAADPRLIYCSLPGFAADDPRAGTAAWEGVVLAATAGYLPLREHWDRQARAHAEVDDPGRPLFTAVPMASTIAALLGALGVVTALLRRERTGVGARLEVPLAEAMLQLVGFHLEMPGFGGRWDELPRAMVGSFECADGRFIDQVSYPRFVEKLLRAAGVWEDWRSAGLTDMEYSSQAWADPELKRRAEDRFARLIRTRPAAEWEAMAVDLGIPFAQVRTPAEWLACEEARASGAVVDLEDPEYGVVSMAGVPMDFSRTPAEVRPRSLPGADRQVVLDQLRSLTPASMASPVTATSDEAPLAGVSVVELSQVVAGPTAGRFLADYGAEVIKVVNPAPTGNNGFHGAFTNRGKRSMFLDVQDAEDQRLLRGAIDGADVMLQNYAFGAVERYGLGFEQLQATRPDLVYVSLSAYPRRGPWRHRRGHENQAVAATGLSARYGGPGGWPSYQPYLICDVGTGIMGALSAALGLVHRARTGQGQHVSSSLAQVATLNQAVYLFSGPDNARLPEPTGRTATGWSALQRLYQAADGWLFLGAAPGQLDVVCAVAGVQNPAGEPRSVADGALAGALAAQFRTRTCAQWVNELNAERVAVQQVREIAEVAHDPTWHSRGILRYGRNGEGQHDVPVLGAAPQPWPIPARSLRHPGHLGADTASLRAELSAASRSDQRNA